MRGIKQLSCASVRDGSSYNNHLYVQGIIRSVLEIFDSVKGITQLLCASVREGYSDTNHLYVQDIKRCIETRSNSHYPLIFIHTRMI